MPIVFLTSASTSPWSRPSDWNDVGHTVELVGAGGQSGAAIDWSTSGRGGAGGGGGGLRQVDLDFRRTGGNHDLCGQDQQHHRQPDDQRDYLDINHCDQCLLCWSWSTRCDHHCRRGGVSLTKSGPPSPNYGTSGACWRCWRCS